ncbi:hypothetical protein [Gordonia sp. MMO-8]|uniref:hypothetical protein n=1 Tax=Gordonia sp. MMO-8 TaxID=3127886 RepID=UPI003017487F
MTEPALFDLPPGVVADVQPAEEPSRGERRRRLIERRIAGGLHPLGYVRLHDDAAQSREGSGLRCGSCRWRVQVEYHNSVYPKCDFGDGSRISGCESSDIRAWWPACRDHESAD